MTPEEVLLKAADEIAEHGHCKETYADFSGAMCAYGAMSKAVVGDANYHLSGQVWSVRYLIDQAAELLAETVNPCAAPGFSVITRFNDAPETTGEDVILAMKKAAHHE